MLRNAEESSIIIIIERTLSDVFDVGRIRYLRYH